MRRLAARFASWMAAYARGNEAAFTRSASLAFERRDWDSYGELIKAADAAAQDSIKWARRAERWSP